jgi:hypothetical protein
MYLHSSCYIYSFSLVERVSCADDVRLFDVYVDEKKEKETLWL